MNLSTVDNSTQSKMSKYFRNFLVVILFLLHGFAAFGDYENTQTE